MGAYESNFVVLKNEAITDLKPSHSEWLFQHAETVGMPISQVQRCWRRFQALGCNKQGVLTQKAKIWKSDDIIVQQVLRKLPWSNKTTLSFQSYLKVCNWFSSLDEITKLRVLFFIINQGNPLKAELLQRFLKRVYADKNDDEIQEIVAVLLSAVDLKGQGFIDEEEFIEFAKKIPFATISPILSFEIIPVNARLHAEN